MDKFPYRTSNKKDMKNKIKELQKESDAYLKQVEKDRIGKGNKKYLELYCLYSATSILYLIFAIGLFTVIKFMLRLLY